MTNIPDTFEFPVGYQRFHMDQLFNYQLNRWYSLGYAKYEDMQSAGMSIQSISDWKTVLISLANKALSEDRIMNAAFYFRAAEFYTFNEDPEKERLYDSFIDLFYRFIKDDNYEKFQVPYQDAFLPVIKISSMTGKKGTIVIHGGFDSYIEEFYSWMRYFSDHGYEVIGFEGPGQGAALKKHGLPLDHEWEKPVKAILDYFKLTDVTLLGISMGGYFCLRAAAFESRIKRVIASGIAFDYLKFPNILGQLMMKLFFYHFRDFSNRVTLKKMEKDGMHKWSIGNLMYITRKSTPMEAFDAAAGMNEHNLHSDKIRQDVLILTGRNDHFIPFKMHAMQVKALTGAKSITARVFTKKEQAQNHCQVGNTRLALDVMVKWIEKIT